MISCITDSLCGISQTFAVFLLLIAVLGIVVAIVTVMLCIKYISLQKEMQRMRISVGHYKLYLSSHYGKDYDNDNSSKE